MTVMFTVVVAITLCSGSVFAQTGIYGKSTGSVGPSRPHTLTNLPAHIRNKPAVKLAGKVAEVVGADIVVKIQRYEQYTVPGKTTYYRGADGKMRTGSTGSKSALRAVETKYRITSHPNASEMKPGDSVNFWIVETGNLGGYVYAIYLPEKFLAAPSKSWK